MAELLDIPVLVPEAVLFPIGLSQAMESIAQTQRQMAQVVENFILPIRQMQEEIVSMMEPLRLVQQMLDSSPLLKMMQEIQETNKRMVELMTIRPVIPYFRQGNVVDREVVEKKVATLAISTTLIPHQVSLPAIRQTKINYCDIFEDFHMAVTIEGRFYYENGLLDHISTNAKHGKFLLLLLKAADNYVTDTFALSELKPSDLEKGLGYIRDDMVKYLSKEGLEVKLYRQRKQGYRLLKISKFSN